MCVCVCVSVSVSVCAQDECVANYGHSGNHTKKRAKLLKEKEGGSEPQP